MREHPPLRVIAEKALVYPEEMGKRPDRNWTHDDLAMAPSIADEEDSNH